jgi:hypothetical protein
MACITKEDYTKMCKKRKQLVYLKLQGFLYAEADKYWEVYDCAEWLIICQWFYAFYRDAVNKKITKYRPTDKQQYAWVSYKWLAQRLGAYGIRNPDTIGRWFTKLSTDTPNAPALLKKWVVFDEDTQHSSVYLCPTEACVQLFAVPTSTEDMADYVARIAEESSDDNFSEEDSQPPEKPAEPFTFPDWWDHFWEEVSATGKYTDKIYKDKYPTVVNGYVQDAVKAISSIMDGTYYDKGFYGEFHDVKYDLSAITIDSIINAMKKYNTKEPVTMKEVVCPFAGKGKNSRKSRFISLVCVGTEWPKDNAPVKPKKLPEADKPENTPNWIWESHQLPSLYPEIQQDDRKFWGFYVTAMEYIDDCQKNKGTDRTKWGLWAKLNNGLTNPANNIFMDIFRSAKEAEMSLDDVYSMHMGDCNNFLWILTARRVKHSHGIKILPDGATPSNDYVYASGPLNRSVYEKKGAKR